MEKENLIKFIEAIEADRGHAAFLLGLRHNAALQYHATNVTLIGSMSNDVFMDSVRTLYPREFSEVERIADQCAQLSEVLEKDVNSLQAVDLFQSVALMAKGAQPEPVAEVEKPIEEAASYMAKCPECGKEFSVKPPAQESEKPEEKTEA